jgi:hypothetical protein
VYFFEKFKRGCKDPTFFMVGALTQHNEYAKSQSTAIFCLGAMHVFTATTPSLILCPHPFMDRPFANKLTRGGTIQKHRPGGGQARDGSKPKSYSSFVLLPIKVFAYEYICSTTRLCILQFTHDRFRAFGQT